MTARFERRLRARLLLLAAAFLARPASAFDLGELQGLMRQQPARSWAFEEDRRSPWLAQPVRSAGVLRRDGDVLEKQVTQPSPATWQLHADRMVWTGVDGRPARTVLYADSPAAAALALALRQLVAGDLAALAGRFVPTLSGDRGAWTLRLEPRDPALSRAIEYLQAGGQAGQVALIELAERNGAVTTTRLLADPRSQPKGTDVRP